MDWLASLAWRFLWDGIAGLPGWLLLIVAGAALGVAWGFLGWRGMVGIALAVLTLGAYRQGWKDHGDNKPPFVPVEIKVKAPEPPPKPSRPTIRDLFPRRKRQ